MHWTKRGAKEQTMNTKEKQRLSNTNPTKHRGWGRANSVDPEGYAVPAPLVAPIVLQTR